MIIIVLSASQRSWKDSDLPFIVVRFLSSLGRASKVSSLLHHYK